MGVGLKVGMDIPYVVKDISLFLNKLKTMKPLSLVRNLPLILIFIDSMTKTKRLLPY